MSFGDDTLDPSNVEPSRSAESEIERRIELLRTLPIIRENGWRPSVSCQWLSNGVKIVSITIVAGWYNDSVATVSRDSTDTYEATKNAFDFITEKLEESYAARDTGQSDLVMGKE